MEGVRAKDLLAQLQDRLGPVGDGERAATLFHECCALLKQGTESETILQAHNDEDTQAAVVSWVVRWLLSNPANAKRLPLSDILACAGTNLVSFFREVPVVLARLRPYLATAAGSRAESIEQGLRLRECQETLVSLTILAKKYKDLFWRVQRTSAVPQPQVLQAGWLTFLLLKAQLLREYPDLVSCLQLLVCVLGCYVANMTLSEAEVRGLMEQNPTAIDAAGRLDTLKLLATAARADYAQVQALMPTVESQLAALLQAGQFPWLPADLLAARGPAAASAAAASQLVVPSCTLRAPGMLSDRRCLSDLVLYLDGSYQAEYERAGEIDEREFLTTDFGALASPRTMLGAGPAGSAPPAGSATPVPAAAGTPGATALGSVTPGSAQAAMLAKPPLAPAAGLRRPLALGLQSPLPIMHLGPAAPATPITQAMGSVAWLHSITRDAAPEPSPALQQLLATVGPDAAAALASRVQEAADAVFGALQQPGAAANGDDSAAAVAAARSGHGDTSADASASGSGSDGSGAAAWLQPAVASLQASVARERREEGLRLYYVALEAMLRAEVARSGPAGSAALATRWAFHSCLLALSFEMVAASYRMGALCFPAIPERLGLAPFDLTKIIPAFVRALPSMPRELKRHLFTVEEKVVETLGWQASSSLYKVLDAAVGDQQEQQQPDAKQQQQQDQKQAGKAAAGDDASGGDVAVGSDQQQQQQAAEAPAGEAAASARADSACPSGSGSEPQAAPSSSWSPSAAGASSAEEPSSKRRRADDGSAVPTSSEAAAGDGGSGQAAAQGAAAEAAAPAKPALPQALGAPPEPGAAGAAEPPPGSDPAARAVMFDFCRKVLKLAAFRLVAISEGLDFSPMERDEVLAAVHDVVGHALYCETHLFYGRHLDQLLLAALYGYCKVNRLGSITFKEIISHYRRQPHAKQEVFRTVTLRRTEPGLVTLESGDIIAFYNRVFVPSMKAHLLRRCMGGGSPNMPGARSAGNSPSPAAGGGGGSASGVSAASAVARHLAPGHINRSPIFTALQHAAAAQQQAAAALPAGGVIVKRAVGARSPLQNAGGNGGGNGGGGSASGGTAYRTLSLDSGASLGGLGLGFGGGGGMHAFGSSGVLSGGADASAGGAPGLAALAAVAADGPGPVRCGSGGASGGPKPSPASGHHVARAYVPSRLGRGGGPAGSGGGGLAGKQGPAGGAGFPWGGNGGIAAYGGGAAPSPTRRSARVTSPRGPLLVGAPTPSSSTDVAQCQDQSGVAGGAHFNSSDDDAAAAAAAARAVAAAAAAAGGGSPYSGPRASPSSVRRVGAKRAPPSALAALAGGGGGGGGGGSGGAGGAGTPSGLATLLQALESTASMDVDGTSPARVADATAASVGPAT